MLVQPLDLTITVSACGLALAYVSGAWGTGAVTAIERNGASGRSEGK